MPKEQNELLSAVKLHDADAVLEVIDKYRKNLLSERPPFEEALSTAVQLGYSDIMQIFLRLKVNVAWADSEGRRAIHHAAHYGCVDIVKRVLVTGSPLNVVDATGKSALHYAVSAGNVDAVRFLLGEGALVNRTRTYRNGETPLHVAADTGQFEIVRMLIAKVAMHLNTGLVVQKGANASLKTNAGLLPLHLAVRGRHHAVVALLCECGVDVQASGIGGATAAHTAVERGSIDTLHLLLEGGADANARDPVGRTPLHYVAACKPSTELHAAIAELLTRSSSEVDAVDAEGRTALHYAVVAGNTAVLSVLLSCGAELNQAEQSERGDSPLGLSVLHEQHAITHLLVAAGADVRRADRAGLTPLHKIQGARGVEKLAITELLLGNGARVNAVSQCGYTPLDRCIFHMVIGAPNHGVLQRLVQAGACLRRMKNSTRATNNSPLCWLTFRGDLRLARLLVLAGWDLSTEQWYHLAGITEPIEAFLTWLRCVARQPRPLMPICRSVIRDCVSECLDDQDVVPAINELPLPTVLKSFLHLNDVLQLHTD